MAAPPIITITRSPVYDTIIVDSNPIIKPEYLYAYTDPSVTGQTLYAWTCEENVSGGYYNNNATYTIYTTTENPTSSSTFYDKDGNEFTSGNGTVVYDNEGLGNHYAINSAQAGTTNGTPDVNFYTYIASGSGSGDSGGSSVIK